MSFQRLYPKLKSLKLRLMTVSLTQLSLATKFAGKYLNLFQSLFKKSRRREATISIKLMETKSEFN